MKRLHFAARGSLALMLGITAFSHGALAALPDYDYASISYGSNDFVWQKHSESADPESLYRFPLEGKMDYLRAAYSRSLGDSFFGKASISSSQTESLPDMTRTVSQVAVGMRREMHAAAPSSLHIALSLNHHDLGFKDNLNLFFPDKALSSDLGVGLELGGKILPFIYPIEIGASVTTTRLNKLNAISRSYDAYVDYDFGEGIHGLIEYQSEEVIGNTFKSVGFGLKIVF